jgi:hypothetical protein
VAEITPIGRVNGKAAKILREASETGEPVFVFRAKDLLSTLAVTEYLGYLEKFLPNYHEMHESVHNQLEAIRDWQREHPHEVRLPD